MDNIQSRLEKWKARYNPRTQSEKASQQQPVFKQGLAKGRAFEEKALKAYAEVERKPLWLVKKYRKKILSEIMPGGHGKDWYRLEKIRQDINSTVKRIPFAKSWEAKRMKKRLEVLRRTSGIKKKAA